MCMNSIVGTVTFGSLVSGSANSRRTSVPRQLVNFARVAGHPQRQYPTISTYTQTVAQRRGLIAEIRDSAMDRRTPTKGRVAMRELY